MRFVFGECGKIEARAGETIVGIGIAMTIAAMEKQDSSAHAIRIFVDR